MKILYKISAGKFGVSISEKRVIKETEKTIIIEDDHYTNLKKNKLDIAEDGIIYDSFVMYTFNANQERIEKVRLAAKKRWMLKKSEATISLKKINSSAKYNRIKESL